MEQSAYLRLPFTLARVLAELPHEPDLEQLRDELLDIIDTLEFLDLPEERPFHWRRAALALNAALDHRKEPWVDEVLAIWTGQVTDGFGATPAEDSGGIALAYGIAAMSGPQVVALTPTVEAALDLLAHPPGEGMAKTLLDSRKLVRVLESRVKALEAQIAEMLAKS